MKIQLRWGFEMQKTEHRTQNTEHRTQNTDKRQKTKGLFSSVCALHSFVWVLGSWFLVLSSVGCATTTAKLPPPPPKYVYKEKKIESQTQNSLWQDTASLFGDRKAGRLNDIVTIRIVENISGSKKAETNTKKDSSLNAGVDTFLGAPLNFGAENFWGNGNTIMPNIKGSTKGSFKGSGETVREGRLVGTITAKVVEVMPNNNLVLEARKETTINNERQILIIRGIARPDDIGADNTISSSKIADAEIYFVGDGIIQDKQRPGWLVRIVDKIWPF